jgi:hypothetical protein
MLYMRRCQVSDADTTKCIACPATCEAAKEKDVPWEILFVEENFFFLLCPDCQKKTAREGRTPRQTIEAVMLSKEPDFRGVDDPTCDEEDYRDLRLLGLFK